MREEFSRVETSRVVIDGISSPELGVNPRIGSILDSGIGGFLNPEVSSDLLPYAMGPIFIQTPTPCFKDSSL